MHFLKKLIKTPNLDNPAKKHIDVHRHFYRYSKGEFIGPALKITKTKTRLTLKGSIEYEDLILEAVANTVSENEVEIKGKLISGSDVNDVITNLGFDWDLKKSSGKTKNFKADILSKTLRETLLESIEAFRSSSYYLISFNVNPTCKVTTKKNVPQHDININLVLDLALTDFKSDLHEKWKSIIIKNNYKITEIILPDHIENWGLKRILATRIGKLTRSIEVDGEIIEKQYSITV
ncbi:MAG: hypothetical protein ACXACB_07035 [Promethearchaeota archaeon]|jgi:hypothetical protein